MAYQLSWFNDLKTILHLKVTGQWTWADAYEAIDAINIALDEVDHGVDVIYDLSDAPYIPRASMIHFRDFVVKEHPNDRLSVVITENGWIKTVMDILANIISLRKNPLQYLIVGTLEQALAEIENRRN